MSTLIFMTGLYKSGRSIAGARIISFDTEKPIAEGNPQVLDVNYNALVNVVASNKLKVENLRVDNGELKGVNGNIERYGILASATRVKYNKMIILREYVDRNNNSVGYLTSNALGRIAKISKADALIVAKKAGIANGKLIEVDGQEPRISAIEGSYKSLEHAGSTQQAKSLGSAQVQQPVATPKPSIANNQVTNRKIDGNENAKVQSVKNEEIVPKQNNAIKNQNVETSEVSKQSAVENSGVQVEEKPDAPVTKNENENSTNKSLSPDEQRLEEAKRLLAELKKKPGYEQTFSAKVEQTMNRTNKISDRQLFYIKKDLGLVDEPSADEVYNKALEVIAELEQYKDYKGSRANSIANSIKQYKRCSAKQLSSIERTLNSYKNSNAEKIDPEEEKRKAEEAARKAEEEKKRREEELRRAEELRKVEEEKRRIEREQELKDKKQREDEEVHRRIAEEKKRMAEKIDAEEAKRQKEQEEEDYRMKTINAWGDYDSAFRKQPQMPVVHSTDEDVLSYSQFKDGKLYVNGFKEDKFTPEIVIPDTAFINGKEEIIRGIAVGAFKGTNITKVKTGKNITDIGSEAFAHCSKLEVVDLSASNHSMIPSKMCNSCTKLETVHIGNYVERIHELAFNDCYSLQSVISGNSVDTIAKSAFYMCKNLVNVGFSARLINDSAFLGCYSLHKFDFSHTLTIGTKAFARTGFSELVIPGNVTSLGNQAFLDCILLSSVVIEEGVVEAKDGVFVRFTNPKTSEQRRFYKDKGIEKDYVDLEVIDAPRSLSELGANVFGDAKMVLVFTGTPAESNCLTFSNNYTQKDAVNLDNSTKVRFKSNIVGADPRESLYKDLMLTVENSSNPSYTMKTENLINMQFSDKLAETFGMTPPEKDAKEPHIKFKAIVNYLQDIGGKAYVLPLHPSVTRLGETLNTPSTILYDDGYNKIAAVDFIVRDTLEQGSFIICTSGNTLIYIIEKTDATDIYVKPSMETDTFIPIKKHLHQGDTIGRYGAMDGKPAEYVHYPYENDTTKSVYARTQKVVVNTGELLYNKIDENRIKLDISSKENYSWIPCVDTIIHLTTLRSENEKAEDVGKTFTVGESITYDELVTKMKKYHKSSGFFEELSSLSDREVERRIKEIRIVGIEKEAQIYKPSLEFNRLRKGAATPEQLTPQLFFNLAESYWLFDKGADWLSKNSSKSLNAINEYSIGKYKLTEYRSNQVVKFRNAYMEGKKNAHVFRLSQNSSVIGAYASRHSMYDIVNKFAAATYLPSVLKDKEPPVLMQDPRKVDIVQYEWFFQFYDVLRVKNGWKLSDYVKEMLSGYLASVLARAIDKMYCSFTISMYKPTGIYYLVMNSYIIEDIKETDDNGQATRSRQVSYVLLPIGNLERALIVAGTTNSNNKKSKFLDEILKFACTEVTRHIPFRDDSIKQDILSKMAPYSEPYFKVREMIIAGIRDAEQYRQYVDDRAVFMLGVTHGNNKLDVEVTGEGLIEDNTNSQYIEDNDMDGLEMDDIFMEDEPEYDDNSEDSDEYIDDEDDDEMFTLDDIMGDD